MFVALNGASKRRASPGKRRFVPLVDRVRELRSDASDAEQLIEDGRVIVDGSVATNARGLVSTQSSVTVERPTELRGETKLRSALDAFGLQIAGQTALDAGAAAGGFTNALLRAGASRVFAVDAGYGQLKGFLRRDPRVIVLERTNISQLSRRVVPDTIDVITLDLSYVSLREAVPQLEGLDIAPTADLVALIKPMFELGTSRLPGADRFREGIERAVDGVTAAGWIVSSLMRSPIPGHRAAQEFFLHAVRQ
jgi:23S rRNA (cytidine1920-2'-O)/16S rRNA (cytidine1409-2'-O)-methyltransferase